MTPTSFQAAPTGLGAVYVDQRLRQEATVGRLPRSLSGFDCHLVQIQPSQNGGSMEVYFTGCQPNLKDLLRVLEVHGIKDESHLLSPFSGEYREAGLFAGIARELLDERVLVVLLRQIGWPVEFVGKLLAQLDSSAVNSS